MDNEPEDRQRASVRASRFAALGFEFGGTVAAGVVLGYYVDQWLGTAPLFILLLTLGSFGGAVYRIVWMLNRSQRER